MRARNRQRTANPSAFALWTRLTFLAVVGSYGLTWLLLLLVEWLQR